MGASSPATLDPWFGRCLLRESEGRFADAGEARAAFVQAMQASAGDAAGDASIPVSTLYLDGRPLGTTPQVGVSVRAGTHTVTFVHPDQRRKSVTISLRPGETKFAAVKF